MTLVSEETLSTRGWLSASPGRTGIEYRDDINVAAPGAGEVLIRVGAVGINFSDILMLEDRYQVRPERPFTPGLEVAGWVEKVGNETKLKVGDFVAGEVAKGGFAGHAILSQAAAITMPETVSIERAAAIPVTYGTAVVALTESVKLNSEMFVLVHAAGGGVGLACVQVAKALGATVIATASTRSKRELAIANGANYAVDYTKPDWFKEVKEVTAGKGVDVVVDTVGGETTITSLRCTARGGALLVVGFASGDIPAIPANYLLLKRISAIGVYWDQLLDPELSRRVNHRISEMLSAGSISPVVDVRHGLEELPGALGDLAERRAVGKLVITVNPTKVRA